MKIIEIGDRKIIVQGIGRAFYEEGLPICISTEIVEKDGVEVSWLHIADELIKNGWTNKKIIAKLKEEGIDCNNKPNIEEIEEFLSRDYRGQRDMIYEYLFENEDQVKECFNNLLETIK